MIEIVRIFSSSWITSSHPTPTHTTFTVKRSHTKYEKSLVKKTIMKHDWNFLQSIFCSAFVSAYLPLLQQASALYALALYIRKIFLVLTWFFTVVSVQFFFYSFPLCSIFQASRYCSGVARHFPRMQPAKDENVALDHHVQCVDTQNKKNTWKDLRRIRLINLIIWKTAIRESFEIKLFLWRIITVYKNLDRLNLPVN